MSWSFPKQHIAHLDGPQYSLTVSLDRPWQGLRFVAKDLAAWSTDGQTPSSIRPLQFSPTPSVAPETERLNEVFVRGNELFAEYQELPNRDVYPRAVWRDLYPIVQQPAVELRLYMQTRWLESQSKIDLCTEFPAAAESLVLQGQTWRPRRATGLSELAVAATECDGGFLIRPADVNWSYGELIYATDFRGATMRWGLDRAILSYPIFLEPLEKGVIRTARIWSVWMDRDGDDQRLLDLNGRLQNEPLPLTA